MYFVEVDEYMKIKHVCLGGLLCEQQLLDTLVRLVSTERHRTTQNDT
jgi:hypothetical protein